MLTVLVIMLVQKQELHFVSFLGGFRLSGRKLPPALFPTLVDHGPTLVDHGSTLVDHGSTLVDHGPTLVDRVHVHVYIATRSDTGPRYTGYSVAT